MGLTKGNYNHKAETLGPAIGYDNETWEKEVVPRATGLMREFEGIAECPSKAAEILLDSTAFNEAKLDNRDRAVMLLIASRNSGASRQAKNANGDHACSSTHGFHHNKETIMDIFNIGATEFDLFRGEIASVAGGNPLRDKQSEVVEVMEKVLDDANLSDLQRRIAVTKIAYENNFAQIAAAMQEALGQLDPKLAGK